MGCCGDGKKRGKRPGKSSAAGGALGGGVRLGAARFWSAAHNATVALSESTYVIPCGGTLRALLETGDLDSKAQFLEFLVFEIPAAVPDTFVVGRAPRSVDGSVRWFEWKWKRRQKLTVWFRTLRRESSAWYYFSGGPDKPDGMVLFAELDFHLEMRDFGWCSLLVLRDND